MAYHEIGKIAITPKGVWDSSSSYLVLDCVSNIDRTTYYIAKKDVPIGISLTDTNYWDIINDVSELYGNLQSIEENIQFVYPLKQIDGPITEIKETSNMPLNNFTIYGKSLQANQPSMTVPAAIKSVGNEALKIIRYGKENKNLININTFDGVTKVTNTGNTFTCAINNGGINITISNTDPETVVLYGDSITLMPGTYIISGTVTDNNDNVICRVELRDLNSQAYVFDGDGTGANFSITTPIQLWPYLRIAAGIDPTGYAVRPMVKKFDKDNQYELFNGTTFTLPSVSALNGIPVNKNGNYTDASGQQWICDTIDMKSEQLEKRIEVINNLPENIEGGVYLAPTLSNITEGYLVFACAIKYFGPLADDTTGPQIIAEFPSLCTHFAYDNLLCERHFIPGTFIVRTSLAGYKRIYMCVDSQDYTIDDITDEEQRQIACNQFKQWWQGNNVRMLIPYFKSDLYTETYVTSSINDETLNILKSIYTIDNQTTFYISTRNSVAPEISISTIINTSSYINDKICENYPTLSGKGNLISIKDTAFQKIQNLTLYGKTIYKDASTITSTGANGGFDITINKKNLIPFYNKISETKNGVTFTVQSDGSIHVQGTANDPINGSGATFIIADLEQTMNCLKVGQRYSVTSYNGGNQGYGPWNDCWFQVYSDYTGSIVTPDKGYSEFTWHGISDLTETNKTCNMAIRVPEGKTVNTIIYPMVRLAFESDATYDPPASPITLPLDDKLRGLPVSSGGNYTDSNGQQWICDTLDVKSGKLIKRCGEIILDGKIQPYIRTTNSFYIRVDDLIKSNNYAELIICDQLDVRNTETAVKNNNNSISGYVDNNNQYPNENWIYFNITNEINTISSLLAWLNNHPITIVYVLNEPVTIDISSKMQYYVLKDLHSQKDNTSIYTNDFTAPEMQVKFAKDIFKNNLPDIITMNITQEPNIIQASSPEAKNLQEEDNVNYKPLVFAHFADIHRKQRLWDRIIEYCNYYKNYLAFGLCGGDYVNDNQEEYVDLYNNGPTPEIPIFMVVGNHDIYLDSEHKVMSNYTEDMLQQSKQNAYNLLFKPASPENWNVITDPAADSYSMYYYKDFIDNNQNIRLIVIDNYYDQAIQIDWFEDILEDARIKDLSVITAMHQLSMPIVTPVECSFHIFSTKLDGQGNIKPTPYGNTGTLPRAFDRKIKEFIAKGGKFIANFAGHEHSNMIGYTAEEIIEVAGVQQKAKVLNIIVEAATDWNYWTDANRVEGTRTYDAFNIVAIDPVLGIIKLIRIGNNTDYYLRQKNVLCYDYINERIISCQ